MTSESAVHKKENRQTDARYKKIKKRRTKRAIIRAINNEKINDQHKN